MSVRKPATKLTNISPITLHCALPECGSYSGQKGIYFHAFPLSLITLKKWQHNTQIQNVQPSVTKICNIHFERSCFRGKTLILGAVPTLFLGSSKPMQIYGNNYVTQITKTKCNTNEMTNNSGNCFVDFEDLIKVTTLTQKDDQNIIDTNFQNLSSINQLQNEQQQYEVINESDIYNTNNNDLSVQDLLKNGIITETALEVKLKVNDKPFTYSNMLPFRPIKLTTDSKNSNDNKKDFCSISACISRANQIGITMHPFPKNALSKLWAFNTGRQCADNTRICNIHFDVDCFDIDGALKNGAVPTINLGPERPISIYGSVFDISNYDRELLTIIVDTTDTTLSDNVNKDENIIEITTSSSSESDDCDNTNQLTIPSTQLLINPSNTTTVSKAKITSSNTLNDCMNSFKSISAKKGSQENFNELKKCAVMYCNSIENQTDVRLYKLPKDEFIQEKWIHNCFMKRYCEDYNIFICHKHFENECFSGDNDDILCYGSIPTLNLGHEFANIFKNTITIDGDKCKSKFFCCVPGCDVANDKNAFRKFFKFPQEKRLLDTWLNALHINYEEDEYLCYNICELHFKKCRINGNKLNPLAVPSENLSISRYKIFRKCCLEHCGKRWEHGVTNLYKFPKCKEQCDKWIHNMGLNVSRKQKYKQFVCNHHFELKCIVKGRQLTSWAVPTIDLGNKKPTILFINQDPYIDSNKQFINEEETNDDNDIITIDSDDEDTLINKSKEFEEMNLQQMDETTNTSYENDNKQYKLNIEESTNSSSSQQTNVDNIDREYKKLKNFDGCCIEDCMNYGIKKGMLVMHKLPRDKNIFHKWKYNMGFKKETYKQFKHFKLCKRHFEVNCFQSEGYLLPNAIPTLNLGKHKPLQIYRNEFNIHQNQQPQLQQQDAINNEIDVSHEQQQQQQQNVVRKELNEFYHHKQPQEQQQQQQQQLVDNIENHKIDNENALIKSKEIISIKSQIVDRGRTVCCLEHCQKSSSKSIISLHKFPQIPANNDKWIYNLGLKNFVNQIRATPSRYRICNEHFNKNCFERNNRLRAWAVPTINLGIYKPKEIYENIYNASLTSNHGNYTKLNENINEEESLLVELETMKTQTNGNIKKVVNNTKSYKLKTSKLVEGGKSMCSLAHCQKHTLRYKISLHKFPQAQDSYVKWIHNLGLNYVTNIIRAHAWRYQICSEHFETDCFENKNHLYIWAVPTLNLSINAPLKLYPYYAGLNDDHINKIHNDSYESVNDKPLLNINAETCYLYYCQRKPNTKLQLYPLPDNEIYLTKWERNLRVKLRFNQDDRKKIFICNAHFDHCMIIDGKLIENAIPKRKKKPRLCAIENCDSTSDDVNIHLHKFPSNPELIGKWKHNTQIYLDIMILATKRICNLHFETNCYCYDSHFLFNGAVPTLHLGPNKPEKIYQNYFRTTKTNQPIEETSATTTTTTTSMQINDNNVIIKRCYLPYCKHKNMNDNIIYYNLPNDRDMLKKWEENLGINLCSYFDNIESQQILICHKHFDVKYFGMNVLPLNAIPIKQNIYENNDKLNKINENNLSDNDDNKGKCKRRKRYSCCIDNCTIQSGHNGIHLHRFPKIKRLFDKWIHNTNVDIQNYSSWNTKVCSLHFDPICYRGVVFLPGSVPTLHLGINRPKQIYLNEFLTINRKLEETNLDDNHKDKQNDNKNDNQNDNHNNNHIDNNDDIIIIETPKKDIRNRQLKKTKLNINYNDSNSDVIIIDETPIKKQKTFINNKV